MLFGILQMQYVWIYYKQQVSYCIIHVHVYACVRTISLISIRVYMYRSRFYWTYESHITFITIHEMLRAEYRTSITWLFAYRKGGVSCMRS